MSWNNQPPTKVSFYQKTALIIFGIFLTVVVLEIGLRLGGFVLLSMQEHRNRIAISKRESYRIMCLGESTTAEQYPPFLEEILNQRNIGIKFSVIDKGSRGINTNTILSRLEYNLDTYHPDMVITMMGVNDSGPHMPYGSISDSKAINFLKSFRTYKLSRLLWLHLVTRKDALLREELLKYKKAVELNPKDDELYIRLGRFYREQGKFSEAAESYKKAVELNPQNDEAYVGLGKSYRKQDKLPEAEKAHKKAIELNPQNDEAYLELGKTYRLQGQFPESEELFKKAIEFNPQNDEAYIGLGKSYQLQGQFSEGVESYKKAMELSPQNDEAYLELGKSYREQNKSPEAEELFKKAIEFNPQSDEAYGALEILYIEIGSPGLAREYGKKAKEIRLSYYSPTLTGNYHKLKAILDKRGVTYVCAQYPMRNVEPLKKIFQGDTEGIIFVDNEKIFEDALQKAGYREYFRDIFASDFGHCTVKGNRLLAENIANTILKELFIK